MNGVLQNTSVEIYVTSLINDHFLVLENEFVLLENSITFALAFSSFSKSFDF